MAKDPREMKLEMIPTVGLTDRLDLEMQLGYAILHTLEITASPSAQTHQKLETEGCFWSKRQPGAE